MSIVTKIRKLLISDLRSRRYDRGGTAFCVSGALLLLHTYRHRPTRIQWKIVIFQVFNCVDIRLVWRTPLQRPAPQIHHRSPNHLHTTTNTSLWSPSSRVLCRWIQCPENFSYKRVRPLESRHSSHQCCGQVTSQLITVTIFKAKWSPIFIITILWITSNNSSLWK